MQSITRMQVMSFYYLIYQKGVRHSLVDRTNAGVD